MSTELDSSVKSVLSKSDCLSSIPESHLKKSEIPWCGSVISPWRWTRENLLEASRPVLNTTVESKTDLPQNKRELKSCPPNTHMPRCIHAPPTVNLKKKMYKEHLIRVLEGCLVGKSRCANMRIPVQSDSFHVKCQVWPHRTL